MQFQIWNNLLLISEKRTKNIVNNIINFGQSPKDLGNKILLSFDKQIQQNYSVIFNVCK